ncbi:thiamine phosphate synthase [Roseomonas acroporae]|uniref:thiamine phosphate synthase n=1 Tax=Roseomonas acroporae TaxID=2937791 RepID=UPI00200A40BF
MSGDALRRALARPRPAPPGRWRPPRLWLFTDPVRLPDPLAAAARLPRGAGVVARGVPVPLLRRLAALLRRRGGTLLVAGDGRLALRLRAGLHLPERRPAAGLLPFLRHRRAGVPWARLSLAAHGGAAAPRRGRRLAADLAFLSPVFPTASHPGAPGLGPLRWAAAARRLPCPAVALGGIDARTARRVPSRAAGLAAIGALAGA